MRRISLILFLSSVVAVLTGCDIEREVEKILGALSQIYVELAFSGTNDPLLIDLTERVARRIKEVTPRKDMPLKFRVLNTGQVNALALPNGRIYIFRGLLEMTETEDELAAVLAHEAGHVAGRHSLKMFRISLGISLLVDLFNLYKRGPVIRWLTDLGWILYELGFSRRQERDADRYGLHLAVLANYDPKGSVALFEKFARREGRPSRLLVYLSTHPPAVERLRRAKEAVAKVSRIHPDLSGSLAHTLIADGYAKRGLYRHAALHYHAALNESPDYVPAMLGLAQAKEAWEEWDEAMLWYRKALEQDPENETAKEGLRRLQERHRSKQAPKGKDNPNPRADFWVSEALREWEGLQEDFPKRWIFVLTVTNESAQRFQKFWRQLRTTMPGKQTRITLQARRFPLKTDPFSPDAPLGFWEEANTEYVKALIAAQTVTEEWEMLWEDAMKAVKLWRQTLREALHDSRIRRRIGGWLGKEALRSIDKVERVLWGEREIKESLREIERLLGRALHALSDGKQIFRHRPRGFSGIVELRLREAGSWAKEAFAKAKAVLSRLERKRRAVDQALLSAYRSRLAALGAKTPPPVVTKLLTYHLSMKGEAVEMAQRSTPDMGVAAIVLAFARFRGVKPRALLMDLDFSTDWFLSLSPGRIPSGIKVALKWLTTAWEREFELTGGEKDLENGEKET